MSAYVYLSVIIFYLAALTVYNFIKSKQVKDQEDMMVAGRSLGVTKMVFTLVCTWIGSGTFIAGAEYAAKAGWSSLWMPAGAWIGIAIIYFLAGKIRTFGQYTIGDILEVRYGKFARLFGAFALIISFLAIVSYQFRAGGYVLNIISDGTISVELGQTLTAIFVIFFTTLGGMIAVAHTDLPNGIIILVACVVAVPMVIAIAGGFEGAAQSLPSQHYQLFNEDFGQYPLLKAGGYFLATMFLLMGVQSMYQKFYSAKTPAQAKKAVSLWIVGTIVVETVVVAIAVFYASVVWSPLQAFEINQKAKDAVTEDRIPLSQYSSFVQERIHEHQQKGFLKDDQAKEVSDILLTDVPQTKEQIEESRKGIDPASIVLVAAKHITEIGDWRVPFGFLLLAAAVAVVISTGMNYLLSPTTNVMRDIYQRFINPDAQQKRMVLFQKVLIIIFGVIAFFFATRLKSVLEMSYFAYTIYGVSITPALFGALASKRVTKAGGLTSIILGALTTLFLKVSGYIWPSIMIPVNDPNGDPFGIPLIYPSLLVSILSLIIVSALTKRPDRETLAKIFPEMR